MNTQRLALLTLLLALILCVEAVPGFAREKAASYPVQWRRDRGMNLFWQIGAKAKSVGDFELFLDKPLWKPSEYPLELFSPKFPVSANSGKEEVDLVTMHTCREIIHYEDLGWRTAGAAPEMARERSLYVGCQTVQHVAKLRPSKRAFLPFRARAVAEAVGKLVLNMASKSYVPLSLNELKASKLTRCTSALSCKTEMAYAELTIDVEAAGDYDGDGVQDLVLNISSADVGPHYRDAELRMGIAVTQRSAGGDLIVLEWW